jgi:glycosyltransferase involved in cell wall biosynthesis
MIWYYAQMDVIYAPSESTRAELAAKSIPSEKIRVYPRGIDIQKFHPAKRNGLMASAYNIPSDTRKLLYVGRVSKEKNLHILANVFRSLCEATQNVHLVIVGDGPYLGEMKNELAGTPCTFTGYLEGEKLTEVFASSDIFVFPSTTDTFGNVVLEAQASGLPVIVTDQGGPVENMHPGQTGLVAQGDSTESLLDNILLLISNPEMISRMAREARSYMEERSFDAAFIRTWEMYRNPDVYSSSNVSNA